MGKTQITFNPAKMIEQIENKVKEKVWTKGEEIVSYAAAISPVYSGAYVKSFSVVPRGGGGGRMRKSTYGQDYEDDALGRQEYKGDKNALKQAEAARLRDSVRSIDPLDSEGFTLRNRSPHNKIVEQKHLVLGRTKDRFR